MFSSLGGLIRGVDARGEGLLSARPPLLLRCFRIVIRLEAARREALAKRSCGRCRLPLGCAPPFGGAPACVWDSVAAGVDSTVVVMIVAFGFGTGGGQTGASWTSASMEEAADSRGFRDLRGGLDVRPRE